MEISSCHPYSAIESQPAPTLLEKLIISVSDDFKDRKIYPMIGLYYSTGKCKIHPRISHEDPEGE